MNENYRGMEEEYLYLENQGKEGEFIKEVMKREVKDKAEDEVTVEIYQIGDCGKRDCKAIHIKEYERTGVCYNSFMNLDSISEELEFDCYNKVYEYKTENNRDNIWWLLEHIFYVFNQERPADFRGHSLSVSDIVRVKDNGTDRWFFCDSIGFEEIENIDKFNKKEVN